jgi:hypothetical protein
MQRPAVCCIAIKMGVRNERKQAARYDRQFGALSRSSNNFCIRARTSRKYRKFDEKASETKSTKFTALLQRDTLARISKRPPGFASAFANVLIRFVFALLEFRAHHLRGPKATTYVGGHTIEHCFESAFDLRARTLAWTSVKASSGDTLAIRDPSASVR